MQRSIPLTTGMLLILLATVPGVFADEGQSRIVEPSAVIEPSAGKEPSAAIEPSARKEPSAVIESNESEEQCAPVEIEMPAEGDIAQRIANVLENNPIPLRKLVQAILRDDPADSVARIQALVALNVPDSDIAQQCECLTEGLSALDIYASSLLAGVSPSPLAQHCLEFVPVEMIPEMIIQSLRQLKTAQYASFFQEVNEILTRTGLDGRAVLVESLIAGEFLREDDIDTGCVGDCITPLAEALVDQLLTEDAAASPGEIDQDEEPFSNS